MGYERRVSIIRGIRVGVDVLAEDCKRFLQMKPHSTLRDNCVMYFEIFDDTDLAETLAEYMHDNGNVIENEFLDGTYYGVELFTIGEYDHSEGVDLAGITNGDYISKEMQEFISTLYPDEVIKTYIVNWVL